MTSKEALERLEKHFHLSCYSFDNNENSDIREYNIIKQDLVNYEVLKEEHNKVIESTYELSKTYEKINKELEEENAKLKKVIDILKDKIEFEDLGEMQSGNVYQGYFNDGLDEEEVEQVKEVFGK